MTRWSVAYLTRAKNACDTVDIVDTVTGEEAAATHSVNCVTPLKEGDGAGRASARAFSVNSVSSVTPLKEGGGWIEHVRPPPPIAAALVPWHDGVARLQTMRAPLGFAPGRWSRARLDASGLLERHGAELLALGWTATDAFGLRATAPGLAVDCYGLALLLDGGTLAELTAEGARIVRPSGAELRMRRGAGRPSVPAWELDQGPAE